MYKMHVTDISMPYYIHEVIVLASITIMKCSRIKDGLNYSILLMEFKTAKYDKRIQAQVFPHVHSHITSIFGDRLKLEGISHGNCV